MVGEEEAPKQGSAFARATSLQVWCKCGDINTCVLARLSIYALSMLLGM